MTETTESLDLSKLQDELDAINAQITKQGSTVRQLKKDGASADVIDEAVKALQALKINAAGLAEKLLGSEPEFDRKAFDDLLIRKMFVVPSFEIHGGVKGLFDLGPPACGLKAAMIDLWRKHFVLAENMLEMECTCLTPEVVLKTSGHVDRFTDLMVRDTQTGECFRADKLLEDAIDDLLEKNPTMPLETREEHLRVQRQADAYSPEELDKLLLQYDCKAPSGEPYSSSFPFNLMFRTSIGPEGTAVGYLRPETAQGLFVNFRRLLDMNAQKMPFAAAQIGLGFRNEIAPRSGLLRVREFCMGEIEHFVDPNDKSHPNFPSVADKELVLFGRDDQLGSGKTKTIKIGEAVKAGLVNNETLGYFMARTQLYMEKIGMDPARLRFRQHLATEMAHYAADCWDLEIKSSYGWVECVGHADRACYDLDVHAKATKTPMVATMKYDTPKEMDVAKLKFDRKAIGMVYKKDARMVSSALEALAEDWKDFEPIAKALEAEGKATVDGYEVTKDMVTWEKTTKKVHEVKFTPSVIEPSFGMGRILYSLLEHSFYQRDMDEQRNVMRFNARVAPQKCAVLPISSSAECNSVVDEIASSLMDIDMATRVDKSSAALGRRYARADEIGVPFAVTVDFDTLRDDSVTIRERDSMIQVRLPKKEVPNVIYDVVHGRLTWEDVTKKYPVVQVDEGEGANTQAASAPPGAKTVVEATSRGRFSRPAPAN
ncbi:glycyl-tRNA synthetase [Nitzschia inconspicua]|uniref:glycine--tRNA ligase n=1 Tax=Nitzschia inconspicua TaxID=303405 RepID=A0A9K3PMC4_9STRA|nr:glycyl-tRNA synthetase [Nitzschia inconspicua]